MSALPAAGWFPDPGDPGMLRWWDGAAWTGNQTPNADVSVEEPALKPLYDEVPELAKQEQAAAQQAQAAAQAAAAQAAAPAWQPAGDAAAQPILPGQVEPTLADVRARRAASANSARAEAEIRTGLDLSPRPPTQTAGRAFVSAVGSTLGGIARGVGSILVWSLTSDRYGRSYGWGRRRRDDDWSPRDDYRGL